MNAQAVKNQIPTNQIGKEQTERHLLSGNKRHYDEKRGGKH